MPLTKTTPLSAVNTIIGAVGEAPVSSLTNSTADAVIAQNVLEEVSREVQTKGWNFNTDEDVPITPSSPDGFLYLPATALAVDVDASAYPDVNLVQRGEKFYDTWNRTFVFTKAYKARIVYFLEFTDLPEAARRYITVRAARIFHDRYVGSSEQHRFSAEEEASAYALMSDFELESGDYNIFNNGFAARILGRR
jgi:hypothetical protein